MNTIVFVGPTLNVSSSPGLTVHGPVQRGDVIRAVRTGYDTIAIIDGYFDQTLPVWHKEILWALSLGREVWGAASMGALRAAELSIYGMRGVGEIFEAFRDGLLQDDDEVAVAHSTASDGYKPVSEALVNIRVTLHAAVEAGILQTNDARKFVELAKACFYPERSFAEIFARGASYPELAPIVTGLRRWLGPAFERRVDQKRRDAEQLIGQLTSAEQRPEHTVGDRKFAFAYTEAFQELLENTKEALRGG